MIRYNFLTTVAPLFSALYFVDTGPGTGAENMECDRLLLEAFSDGRFQDRYGEGSALWRLYGWRPHAISLGYSQDASAIDALKCQHEGIDVVRRPTGGRAVLHADEFTYSFFADSPEPNAELYRSVHEVIRLALLELGVDAEFCRSALLSRGSGRSSLPAACFSASARHELQVMGRKLVGSAQRRSGRALLQHGSLPLSARHGDLSDYIAFPETDCSGSMKQELLRKAVSLEEILPRCPGHNELAERLKDAAERHYGMRAAVLGSEEIDEVIHGPVPGRPLSRNP
ncbi:lipoate--protein ligase family protein [Chlorobium phaeovibrioides]|uniref:Lipoate--protein ligase family protein n=1 Tax=Chlorobium phaeovibrioides TaxID=1094 RepID=A0A432ATJ3_CHLPH|nr:lipoate--protein ligase family protein [Chlorobium phaeovibrioides]